MSDPADVAIEAVGVLRGQRDALAAECMNLGAQIGVLNGQVQDLTQQVAELQAIIDGHTCPPPTQPPPRSIKLYTSCGDGWKHDEVNPRPGLVAAREAVGMEYLRMVGGWHIDRVTRKEFTDEDRANMDQILIGDDAMPEGAMMCLDWELFGALPGYSVGLASWRNMPGNNFPAITETPGWKEAMRQHHLLVAHVRERRPDLIIGHYGLPWRDYWRVKFGPGGTATNVEAFEEMQDANDALAELFDECDVMFPSAYDFYVSGDDPWVYKAMVEEWLRVAYNHGQDVHVCIWHRHHAGSSSPIALTPCGDQEMRDHYTAILKASWLGKQVNSLYCWSAEGYYLDRARMKNEDGSWRFAGGQWDLYRERFAIEIGENWLNAPTPGEWMEQVYAPWYTLMGEVRDVVLAPTDKEEV